MLKRENKAKKVEARATPQENISLIGSKAEFTASLPIGANKKGLFWIGLLAITVSGGVVTAIFLPGLLSQHSKCGQREGITFVGAMNKAQQAYYLEKKEFSDSLNKLDVGIKAQTKTHTLAIVPSNDKAVFNYAISRKDKHKSYVGGVFVANPGTGSIATIVCEAASATSNEFENPTYEKGILACGTGTKELSRR